MIELLIEYCNGRLVRKSGTLTLVQRYYLEYLLMPYPNVESVTQCNLALGALDDRNNFYDVLVKHQSNEVPI